MIEYMYSVLSHYDDESLLLDLNMRWVIMVMCHFFYYSIITAIIVMIEYTYSCDYRYSGGDWVYV